MIVKEIEKFQNQSCVRNFLLPEIFFNQLISIIIIDRKHSI